MDNKEANISRSRIAYIDIAKAIGIILVIVGHAVSSDTEIKRVIYSFHMPLFFIMSGMVIKKRKSYGISFWKSFFEKKAFSLIFPYIIWGMIYSSFSFKNLLKILYGTRENLQSAGSLTSLWFLIVLFVATVICEMTLFLHNKSNLHASVLVISVVLFAAIGYYIPHIHSFGDPLSIDISFVAVSLMLIGYILYKVVDRIKSKIICIGTMVVFAFLFAFTVSYSTSSVGYVLMANAEYGNIFIFYLNAIFGSLAVIFASCFLSDYKYFKKAFGLIGQNTLGIFLMHKPIIEILQVVMNKLNFSINQVYVVLFVSISSLIISLLLTLLIKIFMPQLLGINITINRKG